VGILGLDIAISLTRPGFSIRVRSKHKASVGRTHKITSEEAKEFLSREFGIQVV
jgi:large subunit ribosomal protein L5